MSSYFMSAREYYMDNETGRQLASLIRGERIAHLATLRGGAPMVSMTLYMPEQDFSAFYVHVSRLAWHTQDMQQDARLALSISETDDRRADPFTLMRVSIRLEPVPLLEWPNDAWLAPFPQQAFNLELADFSFCRLTPRDPPFISAF